MKTFWFATLLAVTLGLALAVGACHDNDGDNDDNDSSFSDDDTVEPCAPTEDPIKSCLTDEFGLVRMYDRDTGARIKFGVNENVADDLVRIEGIWVQARDNADYTLTLIEDPAGEYLPHFILDEQKDDGWHLWNRILSKSELDWVIISKEAGDSQHIAFRALVNQPQTDVETSCINTADIDSVHELPGDSPLWMMERQTDILCAAGAAYGDLWSIVTSENPDGCFESRMIVPHAPLTQPFHILTLSDCCK